MWGLLHLLPVCVAGDSMSWAELIYFHCRPRAVYRVVVYVTGTCEGRSLTFQFPVQFAELATFLCTTARRTFTSELRRSIL